MTKKFAVLGDPVEKSLSPLIHNLWYRRLGIDAEYSKITVSDEPALQTVAARLRDEGYEGFNVTVPLKNCAFRLAKNHDEVALNCSSVNTMIAETGGWRGANTDVYGITAALDETDIDWRKKTTKAVIIGAGGAAAAALYALREIATGDSSVVIVNRTPANGEKLALALNIAAEVRRFSELNTVAAEADLLINTAAEDADFGNFTPQNPAAIAFDAVYTRRSGFSRRAKEGGLSVIGGIRMLIYQAAAAFRLWHGVFPPLSAEFFAEVERKSGQG